MKENILTNIVQKVSIDANICEEVTEQLKHLKYIHSYILYGKYNKSNKLTHWEIHYNISQSSKFNKLKTDVVINKICNDLNEYNADDVKYVQSFLQPDITTLLKQYKPLIFKLAKEMNSKWEFLEMEDLMQMCSFVICDLYYKNYYVHKSLIRRSFTNYVLMHIRKNKDRPTIYSLEQTYRKGDSDENITIADMIPDQLQIEKADDDENDEVFMQIIKEVKEIIVDYIGERQYDQLLREYGNKQTTPWSRKLMGKIKAHLFDMGITRKSFNKYYG